MKDWEQRLSEQVKRGWNNYVVRRINLDTARSNEKFAIAGEFLYIEKASSQLITLTVRLNRPGNDEIDLVPGSVICSCFESFYLTHIAQAGQWIDLFCGIDFKYEKKDPGTTGEVQAAVIVTNANANTNQAAAAHPCRKAIIIASLSNTANVWFDIGVAAVQGSCGVLGPGDSFMCDISNTNKINCNFGVGGEKAFVYYEV